MNGKHIAFAVAACLLVPVAASAGRLDLDLPKSAPGDGHTPVMITASTTRSSPLSDVRLEISGGSYKALGATDGAWRFEVIPPRVAVADTLSITVTARSGRKRVKKSGNLRLEPKLDSGRNVTSGALALDVPALLRVGEKATFRLERTGEKAPTVAINEGELEPPVASTDGKHWEYRYKPPKLRYPHVLLFAAASADGRVRDAVTIPVAATPRIVVSTEPNATVTISLGTESFGPFRADRRGRLAKPLLVRPGITAGTVTGVDEVGNRVEQALPLRPPPISRLLLLCPPDAGDVFAVTATSRGQLSTGGAVIIQSSGGVLGEARPLDGGFSAFQLRGSKEAGEQDIALRAHLSESPKHVSECKRPLPPQPPTGIRVSVSAKRFAPEDGPLEVTVFLDFAGSGRRSNVRPTLKATRGQIAPLEPRNDGSFSAQWTLPKAHEGHQSARIAASVQDHSSDTEVILTPGAPQQIRVVEAPTELTASGNSSASIVVQVTDAGGNPITNGKLDGTATGSLTAFQHRGQGRYQAQYSAPTLYKQASDTIEVRTGSLATSASIRLRPSPRQHTIGVRTGGYHNLAQVGGLLTAADYHYALPFADNAFGLGVEGGLYWARVEESEAMSGLTETTLLTVPVSVNLSWQRPLGPLSVRASIGGGALWSQQRASSDQFGKDRDQSWVPHAQARAFLGYPLGAGTIGAELSYLYADLDTRLAVGNPAGLGISLAYLLGL